MLNLAAFKVVDDLSLSDEEDIALTQLNIDVIEDTAELLLLSEEIALPQHTETYHSIHPKNTTKGNITLLKHFNTSLNVWRRGIQIS